MKNLIYLKNYLTADLLKTMAVTSVYFILIQLIFKYLPLGFNITQLKMLSYFISGLSLLLLFLERQLKLKTYYIELICGYTMAFYFFSYSIFISLPILLLIFVLIKNITVLFTKHIKISEKSKSYNPIVFSLAYFLYPILCLITIKHNTYEWVFYTKIAFDIIYSIFILYSISYHYKLFNNNHVETNDKGYLIIDTITISTTVLTHIIIVNNLWNF